MCGFFGVAGRVLDPARAAAADAALAHRGPDDSGTWFDGGNMLGHRRLSIIDLSAGGRQPVSNETGSIQVAFNGEIYNFAELRDQLRGRHAFHSGTDTEVLVHGYEEWGIDGLLRRIRGMYAFALHDADGDVLHLVRDRLGKKPLFYRESSGSVAFASTLPALLALDGTAPDVDPAAVRDYLLHLCVPGPRSIARGVSKLEPGHRAEFRAGRLSLHRYWQVSFAVQEDHTEDEWLDRIDQVITRAVRERLVADVPVGVFLSGGVDSSLVTALAAREHGGRLTTLSAAFADPALNEGHHSRRVAEHCGTDHHELQIAPQDASLLPLLAVASGEPFCDPAALPLLALAKVARQHLTVVLTGDGGDECFAGYPPALLAHAAPRYRALLPAALRARMPALLAAAAASNGRLRSTARAARRLAVYGRGAGPDWVFDPLAERGFRGRLDQSLEPDFLDARSADDPDARWRAAYARADGLTEADRVLAADFETLLPDMFLVKTDVATMAFGLEARSPLLDHELVELTARIPARVKLRGYTSKRLLKILAARYVPRDVIYRRKQGFGVPVGAWMRGPYRELAGDVLLSDACLQRGVLRPAFVTRIFDEHMNGSADHGQRLLSLLILEIWMRAFVDGDTAIAPQFPLSPLHGSAECR